MERIWLHCLGAMALTAVTGALLWVFSAPNPYWVSAALATGIYYGRERSGLVYGKYRVYYRGWIIWPWKDGFQIIEAAAPGIAASIAAAALSYFV